ncbi:hypothetical protein BJ912DRAFT_1039897 [Pholiota molesta]|nr:hypothetical protein BJ912DRAFT_1039897 [Pholiota molesta]
MMRLIHIFCLAALSASSTAKLYVSRDTSVKFMSRQASETATCGNDCQILTTIESCANSASCECTASNEQNIQTCINCLVDNDSILSPSNQTSLLEELTVIVTEFNKACTPLGNPTLSLSTEIPTSTAIGVQPSSNTLSTPGAVGSSTAVAAPTLTLGESPSMTIGIPAPTGLGGNNGGGSIGNSGGSNSPTGSNSTTGGLNTPQGGDEKGNGVAKISSSLSALGLGLAMGMNLLFL